MPALVVVPPRPATARPPSAARPPPTVTRCSPASCSIPRLEASSGDRRMQFLCDSLRQLRDDLDGRLLVTRGRPEERIPRSPRRSTRRRCMSRRISRRMADDATIGCARRWATCHWWRRGRRIWCRRGASPRTTASPYKVFTPFFGRWRDMGWRSAARSGAKSARWVDPTKLGKRAKPVEIPDPGVELDLPAGEAAARRQWKKFVDTDSSTTATTATGPTTTAPAGCRPI